MIISFGQLLPTKLNAIVAIFVSCQKQICFLWGFKKIMMIDARVEDVPFATC